MYVYACNTVEAISRPDRLTNENHVSFEPADIDVFVRIVCLVMWKSIVATCAAKKK